MVGARVAHYEILAKLGEGGMGVVYKARDTHLDRLVAIKFLPAGSMTDPERKSRFMLEARATSALNHPNIITVHDLDEADGSSFIVMEYARGKTLDQLVPPRGLRTEEAVRIAEQVADALSRAHEAGILHRDLKPSNIMVEQRGLVKVLDFGLAKLLEPAAVSEDDTTRMMGHVVTQTGYVVGTPGFLVPEQAEGKPVDARADIFSFGAVFYEMLCGERAFPGPIWSVMHTEPPALPPGIPDEIQRIVSRCLRKEPERRFQHMADVKVALAEIREEAERSAHAPATHRRRRRLRAAVIAVAIAGAGLAAGWIGLHKGKAPAGAIRIAPLTSLPGIETEPSLSPDGNLVAFRWERGEESGIYVQQIGGGSPLRLSARGVMPAFSPDGRLVAYLDGGAMVAPALGGAARHIWSGSGSSRPFLAWTPDGKALLLCSRDRLVLAPLEAGSETELKVPGTSVTLFQTGGWFHPRQRQIAILRANGYENGDLFLGDVGSDYQLSGELRQLTSDSRLVLGAAWEPRRNALLFSSNRSGSRALWEVRPGSPPEKLPFGDNAVYPTYSAAARRLVYSEQRIDSNLWRIRLDGAGEPVQMPFSTREEAMPDISPDGTRIVFASTRTGNWEIWSSDPDGSRAVQLTNFAGPRTIHPRFSPDGRQVIFDAVLDASHRDLHLVGSNGGPVRRLTWESLNFRGSFSPDGQSICFTSMRSGGPEIWKMPAAGGPATQLTHSGPREGYFSADGKQVYFDFGGKDGVWSVPAEGGPESQVAPIGRMNRTAVTRRGIYVLDPRAKPDPCLLFFDFATRRIRHVASIKSRDASTPAVSPDGTWAIYGQQDQVYGDLVLVENFR